MMTKRRSIRGKIFPFAEMVVLFILFSGLPAIAFPMVSLDVSDSQIFPGEQFSIAVTAHDIMTPDTVIAFGFNLDTPPSWIWNGYSVGPGFDDLSPLFPDTDVAGVSFTGMSGDNILLATLLFTPSETGTFDFCITSDLSNPNQGLFLFNTISGETQIIDITTCIPVNVQAVPEPCTLLLLGSSIGACIKWARRKSV